MCICPVCGFSASSPRGQDEHMERAHGEANAWVGDIEVSVNPTDLSNAHHSQDTKVHYSYSSENVSSLVGVQKQQQLSHLFGMQAVSTSAFIVQPPNTNQVNKESPAPSASSSDWFTGRYERRSSQRDRRGVTPTSLSTGSSRDGTTSQSSMLSSPKKVDSRRRYR